MPARRAPERLSVAKALVVPARGGGGYVRFATELKAKGFRTGIRRCSQEAWWRRCSKLMTRGFAKQQ
jgi:hypothetical protein